MGPAEGDASDRWKLGSDLRVLFPPPESSTVASGDQVASKQSGIRSFFDTVEVVKSFLSAAA
jgi:hypothetical protein